MLNYAPHHEDILCLTYHTIKLYGGAVPHILSLSSRRRCVVSFTPQMLYPRERVLITH